MSPCVLPVHALPEEIINSGLKCLFKLRFQVIDPFLAAVFFHFSAPGRTGHPQFVCFIAEVIGIKKSSIQKHFIA